MKQILTIAILSLMALTACEQVDLTEETPQEQEQQQKKSKEIMFVMKGITEEYSTKATLASVNMTDLWVWEGTSLLAHQVSTDADFGMPSVTLTYGSHDLTFVASKSDGQSVTNGVWSTTKVKDTFAKAMNVTVSANSGNSRQVELKRRSSQVCFDIQDAIPTGVKTCHVTAGNNLSLDAALAGTNAQTFDTVVDVSSYVGKTTFKPVVNLLTVSASDEEDCDVMIEFKNASGTVLYHFERTIKLKPNRCTALKGNYFSGSSNEVSVDETWLSELEVPLF